MVVVGMMLLLLLLVLYCAPLLLLSDANADCPGNIAPEHHMGEEQNYVSFFVDACCVGELL